MAQKIKQNAALLGKKGRLKPDGVASASSRPRNKTWDLERLSLRPLNVTRGRGRVLFPNSRSRASVCSLNRCAFPTTVLCSSVHLNVYIHSQTTNPRIWLYLCSVYLLSTPRTRPLKQKRFFQREKERTREFQPAAGPGVTTV